MRTNEVATMFVGDENEYRLNNLESVKANSMERMVEDATVNKGDKVSNVESVSEKEAKVSNEKKISLAQSEKNVVSLIEKLISENTMKIVSTLFVDEINAEFGVQILELENDKQFRNAGILKVIKERFFEVENGSSFVEFKANVSELRQKAIQEYKERFEAEKLKAEQRKAIETQISALDAVKDIIGETAHNTGVNALRERLAAI